MLRFFIIITFSQFILLENVLAKTAEPTVERAYASSNWIVASCKHSTGKKDHSSGWCEGYIESAFHSIENWCVPSALSKEDLHETIIQEMSAHILKKNDGMPGIQLIHKIVSQRWPCKQ